MSIQYSGLTIQNSTFTTTVGTRREIVDGIAAVLSAAGWSNISGSGTGDQTWKTVVTPQGYSDRIRLYDPGAGNCAQVFLYSDDGTLTTAQPAYLLPTATETWRVIAQGYQFFAFVPGSTTARKFVCAGVPYVYTWLTGSITRVGWMHGNAQSDTDVTARTSFRTLLAAYATVETLITNTGIWSATNSNGAGNFHLANCGSAIQGNIGAYTYFDGSADFLDPVVAWGTSATTQATKMGELWDAVIVTDAETADLYPETIDSKPNWYGITSNNVGSSSQSRGTLFVLAG